MDEKANKISEDKGLDERAALDTIEYDQRLQSDSCLLNESPPMVEADELKYGISSYQGLNPAAAYMEDSTLAAQ